MRFSKTKLGAVLIGLAQLAKLRWPEWGTVAEAVGIALGGVGVRDAIAKAGENASAPPPARKGL